MSKDNVIVCPLLGQEIAIGLCSDISAAAGRMLKKSAVPELDQFSLEQIQDACDHCPHAD